MGEDLSGRLWTNEAVQKQMVSKFSGLKFSKKKIFTFFAEGFAKKMCCGAGRRGG